MNILEVVRTVEDWRGIIAFAFSLGFFINFTIETTIMKSYEGSRLLLPMLTLILGFYFGEKAGRVKE